MLSAINSERFDWLSLFEKTTIASIVLATILAVYFENPAPYLIPVIIITGIAIVHYPVALLYLLFASIPVSMEITLGSFGTDLPSEQIMWVIVGVSLLLFFYSWQKISAALLLNPISFLIIVAFSWTLITCLFSVDVTRSLKFLAAKGWYYVALFFFPLVMIKNRGQLRNLLRLFFAVFIGTVLFVLWGQSLSGFSFEDVQDAMKPFYRNHVNYACLLAISFPFWIYLWKTTKKGVVVKFVYAAVACLLIVAVFLSYTRAAMVAVMSLVFFVPMVYLRLIKPAIIVTLISVTILVGGLIAGGSYLDYAPEFTKTITHTEFNDLVSATYQLEDISTMERVYRWVAGYNMIQEKPLTGFGPACFFVSYKDYAVNSFTTYVSDNPEESGIHNYYLMLMVEQGILASLLFIALLITVFLIAEKLFFSLKGDDRFLVLGALSSVYIVALISIMNDMLETDKLGFFFFLSLAILARLYMGWKEE